MDTLADLGRVLAQARLEARLSQEELAERVGISRVTLSRMENSVRADMSVAILLRLARALGLELRLAPRGQRRTLTDVLAEQRHEEE
jgi:transcriptional regulator with XRE-family HTH domain